MAEKQIKHGAARRGKIKRLYRIWSNMLSRCSNPNKPDYKYYGAKGISVTEEWTDYMYFEEWAMNNGYKDELTLDRIDSNGNYCPENCRWITIKEQQNNKKNNHLLTFNNETHTISEWSDILDMDKFLIKDRLLAGWSVEEALTKPKQHQRKGIEYNGEIHSWREWSDIVEIPYKTLVSRHYDLKWSIEKTLTTPLKNKKQRRNEK